MNDCGAKSMSNKSANAKPDRSLHAGANAKEHGHPNLHENRYGKAQGKAHGKAHGKALLKAQG